MQDLKMFDPLLYAIRSELRCAVRKVIWLRTPLSQFIPTFHGPEQELRYLAVATHARLSSRHLSMPLASREFTFPDESITDVIFDLARCVWHLHDWLRKWDESKGGEGSHVREFARESVELRIAHDLVSKKKHGQSTSRKDTSGLDPWLACVRFHTERHGRTHFGYDGKNKEGAVYVEVPYPIPFYVDVYEGAGDGATVLKDPPYDESSRIGDVVSILLRGLLHWREFCLATEVLGDGSDVAESLALAIDRASVLDVTRVGGVAPQVLTALPAFALSEAESEDDVIPGPSPIDLSNEPSDHPID